MAAFYGRIGSVTTAALPMAKPQPDRARQLGTTAASHAIDEQVQLVLQYIAQDRR